MKKTLTLRQRGADVIDSTPATNVKPVSSHIITARSKLCKVLFLALSVTFLFFVCESNISGMAKQRKTCFVLRSDKFECHGQRSRSPGTKNALCTPITPGSDGTVSSAACSALQCVVKRAACVRFMFGKTYLL